MRSRFSRLALATILTVLLSSLSAHVPLRPPGSIDVLVDLSVDGAAYEVNGPGECNYAADASIDGAPARMWSVRRHDTNEDVNFALWSLKKGGELFTLSVSNGGKTHHVNTLLVGLAGDRRGSGRATYTASGKSGRFAIDVVADSGARINGTLACSAFVSPEGNGHW
jgi:hypothetical protein